MADPSYFYDVGMLLDDATSQPLRNQTGSFVNAAGTALATYDLLGVATQSLVSNHLGYIARFRAEVPSGYVKFGQLRIPVSANNLGLLIPTFVLATAPARPAVPEGTRLVIIAAPGGGGLGPQIPAWALPGDVAVAGLVVGGAL